MTNCSKSRFFLETWFVVAAATLLLSACSDSKLPPRVKESKADKISPEDILAKLRGTYAALDSYSDNAILVERGVSRSRGSVTEMPFTHLSLAFGRLNRYAISYEDAIPSSQGRTKYRIASDGKRVRSVANELPEQIHEAIAPRETTAENLIPEPELRQAILQVGIENLFPQLMMLLARDAEKPLFPRSTTLKMLPAEKIEGAACYRIALTEPEGQRVLWIDKDKFILRRMEIPIDQQRKSLDPTGQFSSFSVDLDFSDITLNPQFDDEVVTITIPEGARLVRRFVPPAAEGPSPNLGKPVKEFAFEDLTGNKVTPASLKGKIGVLEFWGTDCAPCKQHTPQLEKAFQALKDDEGVVFYAVSTDPKGLPTETVAKTFESWGGTIPVLRDLEKNAYYNLEVKATPTLMLVSADGQLQDMHTGMLENADDLVKKVRQIQAGEDLVQAAKDQHTRELDEHLAIMEAATLERSLVDEQPATAEISPRKLPEKLVVEEVWKSKLANLTKPGHVVVLTGDSQEILVIDGGEAVVRYDNGGKSIGQIKLPQHSEQSAGLVRAATDADGKNWFLVSGVDWQQVFLFDKDWQLVFSFPDEQHSGIGDARLFDLKSAGKPNVFVGYWGGLGVQEGSLEGQRVWVNRHLDHVLQVAEGPAIESGKDSSLWCTSTRGTVTEITADGKLNREIVIVGHNLISLEPFTHDEQQTRCGISSVKAGRYAVVAFDRNGKVAWSYDLPPGEYQGSIPPIQRIDLPDLKDSVVVAGPDGSLHFLSAQGELIDRFDYGDSISGLAARVTEKDPFLWVSAGNRLTAWRIAAESAP